MKTLSRRTFVSLLALLPAACFASKKATTQFLPELDSNFILQWQVAVNHVIGPYHSVVHIGMSCAHTSIDVNTSAWADLFVCQLEDAVHDTGSNGLKELRNIYRRQVQSDFKNSKTYQVNGYILSQTEACIYHRLTTLDTMLLSI